MKFTLLIAIVAVIIDIAGSICASESLYATVNSRTKFISPSYNELCTVYISPVLFYRLSSYYLEITWDQSEFDVRGNMPFCHEDYVEVFLTRGYISIGKFCSRNAGSPFTMYSKDGYAKIVYHTNGYDTGNGFRLSYRLRPTKSSALGGSLKLGNCYNTYNYADSGVIYSTGWPAGYSSSYTACNYQISKRPKYSRAYIVFMDISLYQYAYPRDCVELSGYNISSYSPNRPTEQLCKTNYLATFIAYTDVITVKFARINGQGPSTKYSGFVAGYVMYGNAAHSQSKTTSIATPIPGNAAHSQSKTTSIAIPIPVAERLATSKHFDDSKSNSTKTFTISLGASALVLMLIVIITGLVIGLKPRRRPMARNTLIQAEDLTNEGTAEQNRAQQNTANFASLNNRHNVPLGQQHPHHMGEMDTRYYTASSYIASHPSANSSSSGQYTTAAVAPSQSAFMAAKHIDPFQPAVHQL